MKNNSFKTIFPAALLCLACIVLGACALPPVKLETAEPLKVDISMRLDIYQHGGEGAEAEPETAAADQEATEPDVETRRRNRMSEIQTLKNSRLVGENRLGLLEILSQPPGSYGEYVRETVAAENRDRSLLMQRMAQQEGIPIEDVRQRQATLFRNSSFQGEWIEVRDGEQSYRWKQKESEE